MEISNDGMPDIEHFFLFSVWIGDSVILLTSWWGCELQCNCHHTASQGAASDGPLRVQQHSEYHGGCQGDTPPDGGEAITLFGSLYLDSIVYLLVAPITLKVQTPEPAQCDCDRLYHIVVGAGCL